MRTWSLNTAKNSFSLRYADSSSGTTVLSPSHFNSLRSSNSFNSLNNGRSLSGVDSESLMSEGSFSLGTVGLNFLGKRVAVSIEYVPDNENPCRIDTDMHDTQNSCGIEPSNSVISVSSDVGGIKNGNYGSKDFDRFSPYVFPVITTDSISTEFTSSQRSLSIDPDSSMSTEKSFERWKGCHSSQERENATSSAFSDLEKSLSPCTTFRAGSSQKFDTLSSEGLLLGECFPSKSAESSRMIMTEDESSLASAVQDCHDVQSLIALSIGLTRKEVQMCL